MDFDRLDELAGEARFVEGIYNYCDRWCERCPYTSRCLVYASDEEEEDEAEAEADPASRDIHNAAFWEKLHSVFEQTREMLMETMASRGIDLTEADLEAAAEAEDRKSRQVEGHELARGARRYARRVNEWFEAHGELLQAKEDQLNAALRMGLDGADPEAEAATVTDAVEVVRWYQYLICAKLTRALHRDDDEDEDDEDFPSDSDGSAKVALISMDRSIAAWGALRDCLSDAGDSILDPLVGLDRLRRLAEQEFPLARAFVRPGFDEPPPPVEEA